MAMGAKLNAFATSCCRIILNNKGLDKVSNDRIYDLTDTSPLLSTVISRQFLGHILRTRQHLRVVWGPHGRSPSGIPRRSFSRQVQEWIGPNNYFLEDNIVRTAQDRAGWRRLTVDCSSSERWWWDRDGYRIFLWGEGRAGRVKVLKWRTETKAFWLHLRIFNHYTCKLHV